MNLIFNLKDLDLDISIEIRSVFYVPIFMNVITLSFFVKICDSYK